MHNNLGNAERRAGDLLEAQRCYEAALAQYVAACGAMHAHVAVVRINMGALHSTEGG